MDVDDARRETGRPDRHVQEEIDLTGDAAKYRVIYAAEAAEFGTRSRLAMSSSRRRCDTAAAGWCSPGGTQGTTADGLILHKLRAALAGIQSGRLR